MDGLHADGSCNLCGTLYRYSCDSCGFVYDGSSNQHFKTRAGQHLKRIDSAVNKHKVETGHMGKFSIGRVVKQKWIGGLDCRLCVGEVLLLRDNLLKARGVSMVIGNLKNELEYCCMHKVKFKAETILVLNELKEHMKKLSH